MSHLPSVLDADDCVSAAEVKARVSHEPSRVHNCAECGAEFVERNPGQRYCGTACAIEGWRKKREAGL